MAINFKPYKAPAKAFTPFKVPLTTEDTPLVQNDGLLYKCTGCGGPVPDGVWIAEDVVQGQVVGMKMTNGPDGEVMHECGEAVD